MVEIYVSTAMRNLLELFTKVCFVIVSILVDENDNLKLLQY